MKQSHAQRFRLVLGKAITALLCVILILTARDGAHAGVNVWTSHGPARDVVVNPDVHIVAIHPTNPATLYIVGRSWSSLNASTVFKSTDGGNAWAASGLTSTSVSFSLPAPPSVLRNTPSLVPA
jgi:hypothetical protein